MAKKRKKVPSLNSTSSADIAFIMLLFFLLTSSMDTDRGLQRRLPPPVPKDQKIDDTKIKKRNILVVLINTDDQVAVGGEYITDMKALRQKVKEFVENPTNNEHMPEKIEVDVPFFGNMLVAKNHVISLLNDRGTSYQAYITVQSEIAAAYTELRNEISQKKFGKNFIELNEEQQKAVQDIYPQKISEAEPKNYTKAK
ncbi:MAG: biopolymer transporter ExbD [Tannerellaceae bacterium]|jgi:biopolymer transport protein ExbD|nr:biopolymer transporter ExbD [Tannerellaceae bacterium]